MFNRKRESGMTLAEVMVALAVVGIMIFASTVVTTQAHQMTRTNSDKEFATQKAISIIEEMKALVQVNSNGNITALDTFDDGAFTNPILTIQGTHLPSGSTAHVTVPGDPISGNTPLSPTLWTYERHITVTIPPGLGNVANDVRLVDVQVYKNTLNGRQLLSEVSSVIRTIVTSLPPTQVYDVYAIAVENVPGWWVYMSNVVQVVKNAIINLQSRNPGLEFREHWINTLAYGRDQQYTPYLNDTPNDSTADIPYAYFYPGLMPDPSLAANSANIGNNYYYFPSFFHGHVWINATNTNGYNASAIPGETQLVNPYPYAIADQYNHAMRYPDEVALYNARLANNPNEQMTLRLLLEDMYTNPQNYVNALVINLHGELMPFPPIRNYSDAAKDPEQTSAPDLRNIRVVTHGEQLAYSTTTQSAASVNLRVYSYLTNPDAAGSLNNLPIATPISILIHGTAAWTPVAGNITRVAGGLSNTGSAVAYASSNAPVCSGAAPGDGTMCYTSTLVGTTSQDTLLKLYNSPLKSPLDTGTGAGLDYGSRLYNMEYIPSPVEDLTVAAPLTPFTHDLTWTSPLPKNTARWVIKIPGGASAILPANGIVSVETHIGDVCGATYTPVCSGSFSSTTAIGTLYPTPNHPANISRTYVYRGTNTWLFGDLTTNPISTANLPITERYQFQGDPRHCPYADLKKPFTGTTATAANESPLGMGYNRYFDNFEDSSYNGTTYAQMIGSQQGAGVNFTFNITASNNIFAVKIAGGGTVSVTLTTGAARQASQIISDLNGNATFSNKAVADVVNGHIRVMPKTQPQTVQFDTATGTAETVLGFDNITRTNGQWIGWNYSGSTYGVKNSGAVDIANKGAAGWSTSGNGDLDFDVPRLFQITRSAIIRSNALWTTMTGWSYYYVGIGNEIGYDSANGFPNSIPVSKTPFDGSSGSNQYIDTITNSKSTGTYYVKQGGASATWWSIPWLGELYPDTAYHNTTSPGIDWLNNGNLPTAIATNPSYFVRDIRSNYPQFPGTDLEASVRRTWQNGCVTMFWAGTAASSFRHSGGASPDTGTIQTPGTDIANHFAFPVPNTMDSNRPFDVGAAAGATPDNFLQNAYVQADVSANTTANLTRTGSNNATVLDTYFQHNSGTLTQSSALVTLSDPTFFDTAFIVVNGLSPTGVSGTDFISNWAFLSLIQSYFNGGLYTDGSASPTLHHVRQVPRINITAPNLSTNLKQPTTVTVTWSQQWLRWDGLAYTTAYSGSYTEPTTALTYQVLYSPSNGIPDMSHGNTTGWYFAKDNIQATPGVMGTGTGETTTALTFAWDVSDTTRFPEANYLIRVEAYRANSATTPATPFKLHYSYHEFRAYISR